MKNHYTYEIKYPNDMKYIGARSCECDPIEDVAYTGSSNFIPDNIKNKGIKTILAQFNTREEALALEVELHAKYNVKDNPTYYNKANQTSTYFTPSIESAIKSGETRKGRTAKSHPYIAKQVKAREKYKGIENRTPAQRKADTDPIKIAKANAKRTKYIGDARTPAQKAGSISAGLVTKGVKNKAKGKSGTANSGFKKWFYITPDNEYVEITTKTKAEYANTFNVTFRQLLNRFHYNNINKRASLTDGRVPEGLRGFVFGNLDTE